MANNEQTTRSGRSLLDRREGVGGVRGRRPDELRVEQSLEQLRAGCLHSQSRYGIVLRPPVGPVRRRRPRPERGAAGVDVVAHRVLGEHGDVVAALDEAADGAELGWHGAAAVDEGEEIGAAVVR